MLSDYVYNARHALRRIDQHESECRGAATYLCNPASRHLVHPCKLTRCARRKLCNGPMLPCQRSIERIFLLGETGFDIIDFNYLPTCVANADLALRKRFDALRKRFRKALQEEADWRWPAVSRVMKGLGWNKPSTRSSAPKV